MALARCVLGKFLGLGCHFFPPPLDVPTFSARCFHVQRHERPLATEGETFRGREMFRQIWPRIRIPRNYKDLLNAANLRHGTDGFTSPTKEGLKPRRLRPGLNPRTWVPKASTLPLDHRSRVHNILCDKMLFFFLDAVVAYRRQRCNFYAFKALSASPPPLCPELHINRFYIQFMLVTKYIDLNKAHLNSLSLLLRMRTRNIYSEKTPPIKLRC
jgi:hypothetical protein